MVKKFNCTACGECCRHIRGDYDVKINPPCFFYGSASPSIFLSVPTLLIYDWEKDLFPKENVIPNHVVYDLKNNVTIVLSYTLNVTSCPLLDGNNCKIYKTRPVSCRKFPCPLSTPEFLKKNSTINTYKCDIPPSELVKEIFDFKEGEACEFNKDSMKRLQERYGDSHTLSVVTKLFMKNISNFLNYLESKGEAHFATEQNSDINEINKKIKGSTMTDISDIFYRYAKGKLKDFFSEQSLERVRDSINKS